MWHKICLRVGASCILTSVLLALSLSASAQAVTVTDDDVNAIASGMYCPVCENIPLDVCPTQACQDWRDEIRVQLEAGATRQQIIDDFVARYGERVVGTPQDPFLRGLSLVTPWLIGLMALAAGVLTFTRWRGHQRGFVPAGNVPQSTEFPDDYYRQKLESDLRERR
jgi:cytochrome c-type biogenesis protein CcmH